MCPEVGLVNTQDLSLTKLEAEFYKTEGWRKVWKEKGRWPGARAGHL